MFLSFVVEPGCHAGAGSIRIRVCAPHDVSTIPRARGLDIGANLPQDSEKAVYYSLNDLVTCIANTVEIARLAISRRQNFR